MAKNNSGSTKSKGNTKTILNRNSDAAKRALKRFRRAARIRRTVTPF